MDAPIVDREKKLSVVSKLISYLDISHDQIINERTYRISYPDGRTEDIGQVSRSPVLTTRELSVMLKNAGFVVSVFGGYDERLDDGKSREICFVCGIKVGRSIQ
jgi:hypothetical protein